MVNLNKALLRAKSLTLALLLLLSTIYSAVSVAQETLHQPWQTLMAIQAK